MAKTEKEKPFEVSSLAGGMQEKTTEFLQRDDEIDIAYNTRYDEVGGVKKSEGYSQQDSDLTSTSSTSTSSSTTTTSTSTSSSTSTSTTTTSTSTTTT